MNEVALNLWDADEYGDGTHSGFMLTAYPLIKGRLNTSVYTSVKINHSDLPRRYIVDDEWTYPGSRKHTKWLQLFIAKQLERKTT
jgi:hypothetical protein